jgi:hypothetical protein
MTSELEVICSRKMISQLRISGHGEERDEGATIRRESKGAARRAQVSKWLASYQFVAKLRFQYMGRWYL